MTNDGGEGPDQGELPAVEVAARRRAKHFVNRAPEFYAFDRLLRSSTTRVLNYHGVGGIGKSTLCEKIRARCEVLNIPISYIDGLDKSLVWETSPGNLGCNLLRVAEVLWEQLDEAASLVDFSGLTPLKRHLNLLQKVITKVISGSQRLESNSAMTLSKDVIQQSISTATGSVIGGAFMGVPGAILGTIFGHVGAQLTIDRACARGQLAKIGLTNEEIEAWLDCERVVGKLLADGINGLARSLGRKLILLIDNYHEIRGIDQWFRGSVIGELGQNVAAILFSRVSLFAAPLLSGDGLSWQELAPCVEEMELKPLDVAHVQAYLKRRRVSDPTVVAKMLSFSRGLPVALEHACAIVASRQDLDAPDIDASPVSLEHAIVARMLSHVRDLELQEVLKACAVTVLIQDEMISAMMGRNMGQSVRRLREEYSFFEEVQGDLQVKQVVREFVLSKMRREESEKLYTWNRRAVEYCEGILVHSGASSNPRVVSAYIHHAYFGDDDAGRLFSVQSERPQRISVREARKEELPAILDIDIAAFDSESDRFSIAQLVPLFEQYPKGFLVAADAKSNELLGYALILPLKREYGVRFECGTLAVQDVLQSTVLSEGEETRSDLVDYLIDALVIKQTQQVHVGALLIKHIGRFLGRGNVRKVYGFAASEYGERLMQKVQFNEAGRATSGAPKHRLFCVCAYSSVNRSKIRKLLPRRDLELGRVCGDCRYDWCPEWRGNSRSGITPPLI